MLQCPLPVATNRHSLVELERAGERRLQRCGNPNKILVVPWYVSSTQTVSLGQTQLRCVVRLCGRWRSPRIVHRVTSLPALGLGRVSACVALAQCARQEARRADEGRGDLSLPVY